MRSWAPSVTPVTTRPLNSSESAATLGSTRDGMEAPDDGAELRLGGKSINGPSAAVAVGTSLKLRTHPNGVNGGTNEHVARPCRIALYSHDAMGMGHARRNVLIAQALAHDSPSAGLLCITGTRTITAQCVPAGIDWLTLPALRKEGGGRRYQSRHLAVPAGELVALRAKTILAALKAFDPDVCIVDKLPRGLLGELAPTLQSLRARGRTRFVLGLRDVLDDPSSVRREWHDQGNDETIRRYYDAVWVYGDPTVYDQVREYGFARDIAAKVSYTGYLDQRGRVSRADATEACQPSRATLPNGRYALCLVGGGEDGSPLAETFAAARLPEHLAGVILAGPMMPGETLERLRCLATDNPRMRVIDSLPEPGILLDRAESVIAMGGYNTVCEVLSYRKRALIVPRVHPRLEQMIRAERLHDRGLVDLLRPEELSAPALTKWLSAGSGRPERPRRPVDLGGLERIPSLLAELLAVPRARPSRDRTASAPDPLHSGGKHLWRWPHRRASDMS